MSRTRKRDGRLQLKTQYGWKFISEAPDAFMRYFGTDKYIKIMRQDRKEATNG